MTQTQTQTITFDSQISSMGKQRVIFIPKALNVMADMFDDGVEVTIREKEKKENK